jgi:3-oxoacyl-[acyl-carrier-protein] synthase-1
MEKMFLLSVSLALAGLHKDFSGEDTILVVSTTKGNIHLLEEPFRKAFPAERRFLWNTAEMIRDFFGFTGNPVVVSNACISGVLAISHAARLLSSGRYRHAVITGGDILTEFVVSGFLSFQALSPEPCRPFDASRNGLSLGEGVGTLVLTTDEPLASKPLIRVSGSAMSNDANHISGPSRTGEELSLAIRKATGEAGIAASGIDYISAHGTATLYNDDMESKALALSGLSGIPLNSYKGFIGHTLGGAGVIESVFSIRSMTGNILFPSAGFREPGVPEPVNVIRETIKKEIAGSLKLASGFGGCNAALVLQKS